MCPSLAPLVTPSVGSDSPTQGPVAPSPSVTLFMCLIHPDFECDGQVRPTLIRSSPTARDRTWPSV
jgi:hypothetical protein